LVRPNALPAFALQEFIQETARRGRWIPASLAAIGAKEFPAETAERLAIVDVVPGRQQVDWQINLAGALDGLLENTLGAPIDFLEELMMKLL
jgi:hypothetical protein